MAEGALLCLASVEICAVESTTAVSLGVQATDLGVTRPSLGRKAKGVPKVIRHTRLVSRG